MQKILKKVGIIGCLLWTLAIYLPFTIRWGTNFVLSYSEYEYMSWMMVIFLALFSLFLIIREEFHLVSIVTFLALLLVAKDTCVFFFPISKISLTWGFYVLVGSQIIVFSSSLFCLRKQKS